MAAKLLLAFCAQALLVQGIVSQCIPGAAFIDDFSRYPIGPSPYGPALGYPSPYAPGYPSAVCPTSGGGFLVQSSSPITPTGVNVISENAIEGTVSVIGELPFLGAVALEGALPTAGAGGINYGCGNGNVAIVTEGLGYPGNTYTGAIGYPPSVGYGYPNVGYGIY